MNCPKCQYPLPSDITVCPNCGTIIPQNSSYSNSPVDHQPQYNSQPQYEPQPQYNAQPQYDSQPQYVPQPAPQKSSGSTKIVVAVIAVILAVAIIGVGAFFVVRTVNADKEDTKTSQSSDDEGEDEDEKKDKDDDKGDEEDTTEEKTEPSETSYNGNSSSDDSQSIVEPNIKYTAAVYYVTPKEGLILRTGPSKDYSRILTISYSSVVEVRGGCDTADDWVYVYYPKGNRYGWVNDNYISSEKPTTQSNYDYRDKLEVSYYNTTGYGTVMPKEGLILRKGPSKSYARILTMPQYSGVTIYGYSTYDSSWLYISYYKNGTYYYGFAHRDYISW